MCYCDEFGRSRSNGTSVIKEIRLKNEPSRPALQGHSMSSEPTQFDPFDDIFSRLDTIHERDGQTDGQIDGHRATAKTVLMHSVAR